MFIIFQNAKKYPSTRTRALGARTCTRLQHQVLVLDDFKSCVLVLEACVLDSSTSHNQESAQSGICTIWISLLQMKNDRNAINHFDFMDSYPDGFVFFF